MIDDAILTRLSRRNLLGAFAAGASAATLLSTAPKAQVSEPAGPPRKGGTLRFCRPDAPDTLDPMQTNSFSAMEFSQMVYDNLVALDAQDQPVAQLALSWSAENGGQEWILTLREGVKFHDGSAFGAADVVATIERSMDRASAGYGYGSFGPVKTVKAEGPYKVRVILEAPFGEFPVVLAYRACRILPAQGIDKLKQTPNGTGPFVFKDFQPGSSLNLVRNENYWNPSVVHLDGIRVVFVREAVAMQAALRGNQVDLVTQVPVETYLVMSHIPGFKAYSAATGDFHTIQLMGNMKPFDNPKVREAFRYIFDRKAIVASALFGQGVIGNDVMLPIGSTYLPDLPQYEQDLPRARKLLQESGVGPIDLEFFTTSDRQPAPKMALAVSEAAAKIGVTLQVRDLPATEYFATVTRKKPLYSSFFSGAATLYDALYKMAYSKGVYNYSGIEAAPGLDAKLDQMIAEVDLAKRKALAFDVVRTLHNSSDRLVPYFKNYLGVSSSKVQGFVPPKFGIVETRGMWLSA
jgi:peptide/nickel transport system substrate-binding protein